MNKPLKNSSIGDRISEGGRYPQYKIFAHKTYEKLNDGTLNWIKIGDPNAGIIDDIQICFGDKIEAYQVKWSNKEKPTPFSYLNLIRLDKEPLLSAIITSREYIQEQSPNYKVHV